MARPRARSFPITRLTSLLPSLLASAIAAIVLIPSNAVEAARAQQKPAEARPAETRPAQTKPAQTKPAQPGSTQTKPLPPPMRPGDSAGQDFGPASVAKAARDALTAGRAEEALGIADRVVIRLPARPDAALVKIEALFALRKPTEAFDAYRTFVKAAGQEDPAILRVMALAVLRPIAETPNELAAPTALGALATAGDAAARKKLVEQAASQKDASVAILSTEVLARLGDREAISELVTLAGSESPNASAGALKTLGDLRERRGQPAVLKGLESTNVLVRLVAVTAAGRLKIAAAKPALQKALTDRPLLLRLQAAGALLALGDPSGRETLQQALSSEFPDARLAAAAAFADAATSTAGAAGAADAARTWQASVTPILANMDGLNRFKAAELLLPLDRAAALPVLQKGATDPNPVIRGEVARIVAADPRADLALTRAFLEDQSAWARVYAASRLTRPAAAR